MKPGDLYRHRESGIIVEVRSVNKDQVRYRQEDSRIIYETEIWHFLEHYAPVRREG